MIRKHMNLKALVLFLAIAGAIPARAIVSPRVNVQQGLEAQGPCLDCGRQGQVDETPETLLNQVHIFGNGWDYRLQMMPSRLGPMRAVGQLSMVNQEGRARMATAFLISACHILTAAHAASDVRQNRDWRSIHFLAGDQRRPIVAERIRPNGRGNYDINEWSPSRCNGDWEVMRLRECVGDELGFLPLDGETSPETFLERRIKFVGLGFAGDRDPTQGVTVDPRCDLRPRITVRADRTGPTRYYQSHSCAQVGGNSGGPIATKEPFPRVMGIHCSSSASDALVASGVARPADSNQPAPRPEEGITNALVPIHGIYAQVRSVIMSEGEQRYLRTRSRLNARYHEWHGSISPAGPWQEPNQVNPNLVPTLPPIQWNQSTKPANWEMGV